MNALTKTTLIGVFCVAFAASSFVSAETVSFDVAELVKRQASEIQKKHTGLEAPLKQSLTALAEAAGNVFSSFASCAMITAIVLFRPVIVLIRAESPRDLIKFFKSIVEIGGGLGFALAALLEGLYFSAVDLSEDVKKLVHDVKADVRDRSRKIEELSHESNEILANTLKEKTHKDMSRLAENARAIQDELDAISEETVQAVQAVLKDKDSKVNKNKADIAMKLDLTKKVIHNLRGTWGKIEKAAETAENGALPESCAMPTSSDDN